MITPFTRAQSLDDAFQQAVVCHHAGQLQEAERLYRVVLQAKPDHPEANNGLKALAMQAELISLFTNGRFTEADILARTMTERFPLYGFGWVMLGMLSKRAGRNSEALEFVQKGAALSPDYAAAHNNLGIILFDFRRMEEAEASYLRALQLKPDFAEAHNNLGSALRHMGRLEEAEASCRRALEIRPGNADAHNNLGGILHNLGQLDQAEASCRRALQLRPDFAEAAYNLCNILKDMSRLAEAEISCR
ncbi:MAG: tetratricopeptide repeat protein, partial [Gallionella sp.]